MRVALEQRGGGHELPGLTVAALRDVELYPRTLERVFPGGIEAFDRGDLGASDIRDRNLAGARGLTVEVNGACAALADAAAVLAADETQRVAEDPEQRSVGRDVHRVGLAIH